MKQCPNPNCILYTRLEELPDAYVKCPGCGGQLVDTNMTSGVLPSGYLTKLPGTGLSQMDLDQEFGEAFPQDSFGFHSEVAATPAARPGARPQQQDDEYYPYDDTEQDESVQVQSPGISRAARIAYGLALLLLLLACGLFAFVLTTRILPARAVTGAEATETAIVEMGSAVNTPVPSMPTVPQLELPPAQPSPTTPLPPQVEPPTQAPAPPTAIVTNPQPPSNGGATQPIGGITNAQMVTALTSGQPVDNVTSYGANDPFVVAVQAQFGPGGVTTTRARWYGPDSKLLYEKQQDFTTPGTYYTGFTLKKDTPWLEGNYRVDIHTNGSASPAYSVSFSVRP